MNTKRAEILALDLMNFYGLSDWSLQFDRSLTRLGLCSHRTKTISLSRHATEVNSEKQVLDTMLHEIAHALVGPQHGHDNVWRAKAIELGDDGARCGDIAVKAPSKYHVVCGGCNIKWNLYRLTNRYKNQLDQMWHKECGREKSKGKLILETVVGN